MDIFQKQNSYIRQNKIRIVLCNLKIQPIGHGETNVSAKKCQCI